jgi:hypothetical protein
LLSYEKSHSINKSSPVATLYAVIFSGIIFLYKFSDGLLTDVLIFEEAALFNISLFTPAIELYYVSLFTPVFKPYYGTMSPPITLILCTDSISLYGSNTG